MKGKALNKSTINMIMESIKINTDIQIKQIKIRNKLLIMISIKIITILQLWEALINQIIPIMLISKRFKSLWIWIIREGKRAWEVTVQDQEDQILHLLMKFKKKFKTLMLESITIKEIEQAAINLETQILIIRK
jgi:hypothetical protein